MKFELAHEKEEEEEKKVIISTEINADGNICIMGRVIGGEDWALLQISEKGIYRCYSVEKELGLPLDGVGRIKLEN